MKMNVILKKVFCVDIFDSVFFMFSVSRTKSLILEFLIFTDFLHLQVAWVDRFYILPSLDFSSNADFTNFHCFAWQVIGASCNLPNISIRRNSNSISFLFQDEIQTRIFNIDEEQLCYGRPNVIFPKKAKNLNDEWVWVVNIANYTQSVEVVHGRKTNNQAVKIFFL